MEVTTMAKRILGVLIGLMGLFLGLTLLFPALLITEAPPNGYTPPVGENLPEEPPSITTPPPGVSPQELTALFIVPEAPEEAVVTAPEQPVEPIKDRHLLRGRFSLLGLIGEGESLRYLIKDNRFNDVRPLPLSEKESGELYFDEEILILSSGEALYEVAR